MADISKIKMPNNNNYDLKDSTSRTILADMIPEGVVNKFELVANVNQDAYQMHLTQLSASSFHIEGTASGQWDKKVGTITLPAGTWKMQANISGGQNNFYFYAQGTSPVWRTNSTSSSSANICTIAEETTFNIFLRVTQGYSVNMDVKLAIGLAEKFNLIGATASMVDHALTNSELTAVASGLVDRGAKNLSPVNNVIFTRPTGAAYTEPISINLASGEYIVRYKLTTTANSAVAITYDGSEHTFYDSSSPYSDTVITHNFTVVNSGTSFRFYFNQAATVSELMICTKADWDASYNYEPYAPTNSQLYEMIKALQNGGIVNTVFGIGETIPNNSDLNDVKIPGAYYSENSTSTNTMSNVPEKGSGFRLVVEKITSTTYMQRFYKPTVNSYFYMRTYSAGAWLSWCKFEGTAIT